MIYISFAQAAVYDAVVAIKGRYEPYALQVARERGAPSYWPYMLSSERRADASVDAAVATAAYSVLVHYFPAQKPALDADDASALAAIPHGAAKSEGIRIGQLAANAVIEIREGDGLEPDIGFVMPTPAPGVWQLAAGVLPQTPWVSRLRPFMLKAPDQFRPGAPPALTSPEWAAEFNETKAYGGSVSAVRTSAETDVARFWSTNAVSQYNRAYASIVQSRNLDAVQAARLFAMGNLVGADALIACFDAKYHYLFWRPQFSVPLAGEDGNPATTPDSAWTPLLATPNHPEYPAAHGCLTAAEAEVFATFFGTHEINVDLSSSVANLTSPTRHYDRVSDLLTEIVNARVWGGLHYRGSGVEGVELGRKVAHWSLERFFRAEDRD